MKSKNGEALFDRTLDLIVFVVLFPVEEPLAFGGALSLCLYFQSVFFFVVDLDLENREKSLLPIF